MRYLKVLLILNLPFLLFFCSKTKENTSIKKEIQAGQNISIPADAKSTASGLRYVDLVTGNGPLPHDGQTVIVHYTGWLMNGKKFDSSLDRNKPFSFVLGAGQVIPGWEEGIRTMHVGCKRRLFIPYQLAYGEQGYPPVIPPKAMLVFDVELLEIQ